MSVWGTIWSADDLEDRGAPIAYRGSHVLPSEGDPRCGSVDLAEVPPHITRDGRDDGPEDEWTPWPFLRLGVGVECAVLDEALARSLYEALGGWLEQRGAR